MRDGENMNAETKTLCNIHDATDYVIGAFADEVGSLNVLKLQKLLYYVQAWHLAKHNEPLFEGKFQAWVHGPVSRDVYDRFKDTHSLYSTVTGRSIRPEFSRAAIDGPVKAHLDEILDAYGQFTGTQLEDMTHDEQPWVEARGDHKDYERCEVEISERTMGSFYKSLLAAE
jgi:uncharacterized phage-associated protein